MAEALPPELLLACACCRWPRDAARGTAVRRALEPEIDWPHFLAVARRHRVEPLAADALREEAVPAEVRAELGRRAGEAARMSLLLAQESLRLQEAFERGGLSPLFLKGETLAVRAYGALGLKSARDVDLLIEPEELDRAAAILEDAGYRRIDPPPDLAGSRFAAWMRIEKETVWRHDRAGLIVDLHHRLVNNSRLLRGIGARSPRQEVRIAERRSLPTLRDGELFAYLCLHGALHGWMRLKWVADVGALLSGQSGEETVALYRAAERLGAGRAAGQALLLCRRLLGLELPRELQTELDRSDLLQRLEQVALAALSVGGGAEEIASDPAVARRVLLSHFLLGRGWRFRLEVARERLTSLDDRALVPLPLPLAVLFAAARLPFAFWRRARGAA